MGWTWGEEFPSPETRESWLVWKYKESAQQAKIVGGAWGQMHVLYDNEFVSTVKDTGGLRPKRIRITFDDYNAGSGGGSIYWRGSETSFAQDSDEIAGPIWQNYSGWFITNLRFLQVKVSC